MSGRPLAPGAAARPAASHGAAAARPDEEWTAPAPEHRVLATAEPPAPSSGSRKAPGTAAGAAPSGGGAAARQGAEALESVGHGPALRGRSRSTPDICRLGQSYGGWAPGSQAATICRRAYGR
ncbi:hypothetical protein [Actinacidiphila yeochonensis]|uniref:hypothetical protein n=1 Tax=Actinacidiphila yeochonensis TaxID=89050 RepID=UPI00068B74A4|nr:hypothetical protein [Actinacidiphila yeochonensis]